MGFKHGRNELDMQLGLEAEMEVQTEFYMHFPLPCGERFLTALAGDSTNELCC